MAGWLVVLRGRDPEVLRHYARTGVYGTIVGGRRLPDGRLQIASENTSTFADFCIMRPGDLLFFFTDRLTYGVGELVALRDSEPVLCNWPSSDSFGAPPADHDLFLWNDLPAAFQARLNDVRWICTFRPAPAFFTEGVDMDYVLQMDRGNVLHHLRVLSGRAFFKLEDAECRLISEALLRRNRGTAVVDGLGLDTWSDAVHDRITETLVHDPTSYVLDPKRLLSSSLVRGSSREGGVHAWLAHSLARAGLQAIFGDWTYIGNLEPASPLKPREYMEEMDLFGYAEVAAEIGGSPVRFTSLNHLIEVKDSRELVPALQQTMKYVDWVSHQRAAGDYALVDAFLVAPRERVDDALRAETERIRVRAYVEPVRPYPSRGWDRLTLLSYELDVIDPAHADVSLRREVLPA